MRLESTDDLPNLWEATYDLVAQVPKGKVTTYGEVAKALGDVVASRFVGLAMSRNQDIVRVPCRRVVQSDGNVGGYTGGGPEKKIRLLRKEGVRISGGKVVGLQDVLFKDFETRRPLAGLRARQRALKKHLSTRRTQGGFKAVVGVDVAYENDHGHIAAVKFDFSTGKEIERRVEESEAEFPYVPTYLAFREIPMLRSVIDLVGPRDVLMYDGNGVLHPEGFGIASQIGVVFGIPTIGVAKKLLCGTISARRSSGMREVVANRRVIGHALQKDPVTKPVFVSAGHRVSPSQAVEVARRFLVHRIPEPTRIAHIAAEAAKEAQNKK